MYFNTENTTIKNGEIRGNKLQNGKTKPQKDILVSKSEKY